LKQIMNYFKSNGNRLPPTGKYYRQLSEYFNKGCQKHRQLFFYRKSSLNTTTPKYSIVRLFWKRHTFIRLIDVFDFSQHRVMLGLIYYIHCLCVFGTLDFEILIVLEYFSLQLELQTKKSVLN
jgi:hypothetical protein